MSLSRLSEKLRIPLLEAPTYPEFVSLLTEIRHAISELENITLSFDDMIKLGLIMKEIDKNCRVLKSDADSKSHVSQKGAATDWPTGTHRDISAVLKVASLSVLNDVLKGLQSLQKNDNLESPNTRIQASKYPGRAYELKDILNRMQVLVDTYLVLAEVLNEQPSIV